MSIIFSVAIIMLAVVVFAVMLDAVVSVSRKPIWVVEADKRMSLKVIDGIDRRKVTLPFVGTDRREVAVVAPAIRNAA